MIFTLVNRYERHDPLRPINPRRNDGRWPWPGLLVLGAVVALIGGSLIGSRSATAKDYYLAIGGGYDASGNPVSLERDVRFAADTVAAIGGSKRVGVGSADGAAAPPAMEIYFADGDDPARDVQFADAGAAADCPPAVRIMAELFGDPDAVGFRYRDHQLEVVTGPTDFTLLERRFRALSRELKSGDRLLIYAAGHGGEAVDRSAEAAAELAESAAAAGRDHVDHLGEPAGEADEMGDDDADPAAFNRYDTSLNLWNRDEVTASELCRWLDRLPADVPVVLVMGQCFSGGFAHTIFQGADAELGLSPALRCGFFSQRHDRGAAGCAADINSSDVREYSSYFWAAFGGKTRDVVAVNADYDENGHISFAEAHAYAVIESDEIDVPVRTSDVFLRAYSRFGEPYEPRDGAISSDLPSGGPESAGNAALAVPSGSIPAIALKARPDQRAILKQLPAKLGADRLQTVEQLRVELGAAEERLADALNALDAAMAATDEALVIAQDEVYGIWPELYEPYSAASAEIAADDGEKFSARVQSLGSYSELLAARKREKRVLEESEMAESAVAQLERLLGTIENVVLAENLPQVAPRKIVERYQALLSMEESGIE